MIRKHELVSQLCAHASRRRAVLASALALASCVSPPNIIEGDEAQAILQAYRTQSEQVRIERETEEASTIRRLQISQSPDGGDLYLSVDLVNADLTRVINEILNDPRVSYRADTLRFGGRTSARFERLPLEQGLNVLLERGSVQARSQNGVLVISDDDVSLNEIADSEGAIDSSISHEIELKHISADDAAALIVQLFPEDDILASSPVSVGSISELNTVYVSGAREAVAQAVRIINRADRPIAHVIIEALVVDINTSSVESLRFNFEDGTAGKFSIESLIPGQTGGNIVAAFTDLADNSAAVTATIDFLAANNVAQILARPYIATRSTQPAKIEIVDDQFVRVATSSDQASIISTDSVTAGISMQITPIVMADDAIRIDLSLEDSRFGATAGDVLITKQRNAASTSMIVQSGQTIMIGGLNSRYRITEKAGLPWLRHIPVLNLLAGEQGALERRSELVVYLTPYVWIPGLDSPLPMPGSPEPEIPKWLGLERGGRPD